MQKNNETNSAIDKKIEALQNDVSYSWKQTAEIIDIIYRTALEDFTNGRIYEKFTSVKPEIPKWKKIEKPIQNDKETSSVIKSLKAELEKVNNENKKLVQNDKETSSVIKSLKDELEKVKNENKKLSDELKDVTSLNDTPSFKSGQISALKFALLTLNANDRVDSFNILKEKYTSLQLTLKND